MRQLQIAYLARQSNFMILHVSRKISLNHFLTLWISLYICSFRYAIKIILERCMLRSWVQIPPCPFLSVVQLLHCFEFIIGSCRTKSLGNVLVKFNRKKFDDMLFGTLRLYICQLPLM